MFGQRPYPTAASAMKRRELAFGDGDERQECLH
jgi:hypothetical protein